MDLPVIVVVATGGNCYSRHIPNTRGPASAPSESGGWEWEWKLERKPIPRLNLSILCPIQSTPLPAADTAKTAVAVANKEKLQPREEEEYIHTIWYISNRAEQGASGQGERIKHNSCTYSVNTRNFRYHHHRCCPGQDRFGKVRRSFGALRGQSPTHIEGGVMVGTGTRAQIKHNEL